MSLEEKRQPGGFERMEGVARLMEQRAQVVVHSHGVHEDERHLSERKGLAVPPGSLAFAVVQVEEIRVRHAAVVGLEIGIDMCEHITRAIDERLNVIEWLEGRATLG